jgi:hypothetical protein
MLKTAVKKGRKPKMNKRKIDGKGRWLKPDGFLVRKGTKVELPAGPLMIQADDTPILLCIRYSGKIKDKRIEILPVDMGPEGTEFEYRIVYEPDFDAAIAPTARGKSPFAGISCEDVWAVSEEEFTGYKFGEHTPTGGGEGGGTVGGGS